MPAPSRCSTSIAAAMRHSPTSANCRRASARMQENSLIVQWVHACLERRVSSYRWGLERLVLQAPDPMAADADRLIGELAAQTANPPVQARPAIGAPATTKG